MNGAVDMDCCVHNSFLSPSVKKLIIEIGLGRHLSSEEIVQSVGDATTIISKAGAILIHETYLLDINECVAQCLPITFPELPWTSEDYVKAVAYLSPIFQKCQHLLETKQFDEFSSLYTKRYEWTKNVKLLKNPPSPLLHIQRWQTFLDAFQLLASNQRHNDLLALLLLSGEIEHALSNVYLLNGRQCPTLLKDLLCTKELKDIFGASAIKLLHIVIGPPISLNLRNVAWHGFFSVGELPKRYVHFLLVLVASLDQILLSNGISSLSISDKTYHSLDKAECIADRLTEFDDDSLEKIEACIYGSWYTKETNKAFIQGVFYWYKEGKYGFSCVQALPLIEHILRQLFVTVNNCPDRLLTAEASTLYTTFEEILNHCLPDDKENRLIPVLGESFLDLLHDLLIYPNGPRARDKLSHGEVDFYSVPQSLANVILTCMVYLSIKPFDATIQDDIMARIMSRIEKYETLFHPLMMLKSNIIELSENLFSISKRLGISLDLDSWIPDLIVDLPIEQNLSFQQSSDHMIYFLDNVNQRLSQQLNIDAIKCKVKEPFSSFHDSFLESLMEKRISTLHRWQKSPKISTSDISESEIVTLLLRTIDETSKSLSQTHDTLLMRREQFVKKALRSRQRDNLRKQLYFLPSLHLMTCFILVLSVSIIKYLEKRPHSGGKGLKLMQKFLKTNLQATENIRTYTATDNNKWTQSEELILNAIRRGVEFSTQWEIDS